MQPREEGVGYHMVHLMLAWQQGRSSAARVKGSLSPLPPVFAGAWQEAASLAWDLGHQGGPSSWLQSCDSLSACPPRLPWVGEAALLAPPSPCLPATVLYGSGYGKTAWHLLLSCFTAGGFGGGGGFAQRQGIGLCLFGACVLNGGPSF